MMVLPSEIEPSFFLPGTEFGLTAIVVMTAFIWPQLGPESLSALSEASRVFRAARGYPYISA